MRKEWFLIPLALVLVVWSAGCNEQAPTEPSTAAEAATPFFKPLPSPLRVDCAQVGSTVPCERIGNNFYGADWKTMYYDVCPATKGTVVVQFCVNREGNDVPAEDCLAHEGKWKFRGFKWAVASNGCEASMFSTLGSIFGQGMRLLYRAQGSGYHNGSVVFNAFDNEP
jgi:hypothetical protein